MTRKGFGLKKFFFSFVVMCAVIYIFKNYSDSAETMIAERGSLEDMVEAKGIVVKDEEVYNANLDGNITYYFEDGEKIKEGILVADINTDSSSAQINNQISEIQSAIDYIKNNQSEKSAEHDVLTQESLSVFNDELQTSILNKDLDNIYSIVGQVNNNSVTSFSYNKYGDYSITELESLKNSLLKSLETNKIPYYSSKSGIISYKFDGMEELYKYENVFDITPSSTLMKDYEISDKKNDSAANKGDNIYKIIRNFDYYISATVDNKYAKSFEENKYIKTRIKCDGSEHELWGFIKKINYGSEESVLIIYFDDYFYKIYDKRYVDLQLITDIYDGIKIETKSITVRNGLSGVYIKDVSNIIKFFPVEILGQNENVTVISVGEYQSEDQRRVINVNDNIYETIKIYDKIITEPDKVYEGQIVD